ncbi:MAG: GAF domain-containing protein, partial [Leptospiraceae bacterium]|nr:GAF domain-containing protein [Leptospiraceae bacterium]
AYVSAVDFLDDRLLYGLQDLGVAMISILAFGYLFDRLRRRNYNKSRALLKEKGEHARARNELEAINVLTDSFMTETDLDGALMKIMHHLEREYQINGAIFMVPDESQQKLFARRRFFVGDGGQMHSGVYNVDVPMTADGGMIYRAFQRRRPFYMANTQSSLNIFRRDYPGMERDRALVERLGLKSFVLVPLIVQNENLGIALFTHFDSNGRGDYLKLRPADITRLQRFSSQIAGALYSAMLVELLAESQRKQREARMQMQALNRFIRRISDQDRVENALHLVKNFLRDQYGIGSYCLYVMNNRTAELELMDYNREDHITEEQAARVRAIKIPLRDGGAHEAVCRHKRYVYFKKLKSAHSPNKAEQEVKSILNFEDLLIVPLIRQGEVIGTLTISFKLIGRTPSRQQLLEISLFGEQIAGVLYNFMLLDKAEREKSIAVRAREDIQQLNAYSNRLNATSNHNAMVREVYDFIERNFPFERSWLLIANNERDAFEYRSSGKSDSILRQFFDAHYVRLSASKGLLGEVLKRKQMVLVPDVQKRNRITDALDDELIAALQLKDLLYAPLILQNEVVGILGFSGNLRAVRELEGRRHLQLFCEQTAGALQRSMLTDRMYADQNRLARIGQTASSVIHDLKNPMSVIKLYAEMSDDESVGREKRQGYLQNISREVESLGDMLYEILDFAGGDSGLHMEPVALDELIETILEFKAPDMDARAIKVELNLNCSEMIMASGKRLRRAIGNLIQNAAEALEQTVQSERTIRIETTYDHPYVQIAISDNGPGIPEKIRSGLFAAFVTHGKDSGTGLGLSIVKNIIESHWGSIVFESETGAGTTFRITLPVSNDPEIPAQGTELPDRRTGERRSGTDRRDVTHAMPLSG